MVGYNCLSCGTKARRYRLWFCVKAISEDPEFVWEGEAGEGEEPRTPEWNTVDSEWRAARPMP